MLAQIIDNLGQFGQLVGSLAPSSSDTGQIESELASVESTLEGQVQEIQQYSNQILAAISTLSQEVFGNAMAGYLANADEAGIALSEWEQNQSSDAQAQALSASSNGLSGMVEEYALDNYPGPSMMIILGRVALQRMAVLSIFPTFRAPADNQQLQTAVGYLTTSVNTVATMLTSMNQVHTVSSSHSVQVGKSFITIWTVTVSYSNVQGNDTYTGGGMGSTLQAALQKAAPAVAQADQVQQQGLASDMAYYQVDSLQGIIQQIQKWLAG